MYFLRNLGSVSLSAAAFFASNAENFSQAFLLHRYRYRGGVICQGCGGWGALAAGSAIPTDPQL